jgi:hypothetical protein
MADQWRKEHPVETDEEPDPKPYSSPRRKAKADPRHKPEPTARPGTIAACRLGKHDFTVAYQRDYLKCSACDEITRRPSREPLDASTAAAKVRPKPVTTHTGDRKPDRHLIRNLLAAALG